ncbi:sigma-54-dependent Fis family transcriptional regulator [hot springs metagenome]|uniref:Sigma-54-dependent Fis family transcriptional regulator n=1 Tax=hot springs metagenome TaxID=433727 RepID=A0A5J4L0M9_9ZZZZ
MNTTNILVIDDDLRMRQFIGDLLKEEGISHLITDDSRNALKIINEQGIDIVITDLKMPNIDGIGILEHAKEINPDIIVIVITGYGTIESAIEAMKKGAYDYIQKPFEPDDFLMLLKRAIEHVNLIHENKRLIREVEGCKYDEIVGTSRAINELKELISKVAPFDTTVLLQGETGTGKELVARLIHRASKRKREKFLPVNCGALSESLLEAELFGYEKGAFTGADIQKKGIFEAVNKGTIFLDEINTTSTNFQVKLLRVIQEGSFMRVGGTEPVSVDIRIIAASNVPIEKEVESGRFRKDLYYRLNVATVNIPPLRRRKEDIPLLAFHFLNKYANKYNKKFSGISTGVLKKLVEYSWPGNVRELENIIERAVLMESGNELKHIHLPKDAKIPEYEDICSGLVSLEDVEKYFIQRTLKSLQGQKAKAADVLGISTTSLWRKLKKYNLE